MPITYQIAMAAGRDAGNRSMANAGRSTWSTDDYNVAAQVVENLLGSIPYMPPSPAAMSAGVGRELA